MDFAFLHNDTQWIFDEVQLMGAGLATSTQLEGFRRKLQTEVPSRSLWVSATLHPDWLRTVDFQQCPTVWRVPDDFPNDRQSPQVLKLMDAPKRIQRSFVAPMSDKKADLDTYATALAEETWNLHQEKNTTPEKNTTLVVLNTVARAQAVHKALQKMDVPAACLALIHSRFRPKDRERQMNKLPDPRKVKNLIVVATQAIEAGIDLSAAVMLTELAPPSSLTQRFGRVNRYGELNGSGGGTIRWIDLIEGDLGDALAAPYTIDELKIGRERIAALKDACPSNLAPPASDDHTFRNVIRSRDILDLYDTDPDLTGFDVDIAPYVRDAEDTDIRVFWRDFDLSTGPEAQPGPSRNELCAVPIGRARDWLKNVRKKEGQRVFRIDPQARANGKGSTSTWAAFREEPWPGLVLMVHKNAGGYEPERGFDQAMKAAVEPLLELGEGLQAADESSDADSESTQSRCVELTDHLSNVALEAEHLCDDLGVCEDRKIEIIRASRWHDLGKAHAEFQTRLVANPRPEGFLAKAPEYDRARGRPYFRHELASALAFLAQAGWEREADLVAYLIATHHGKVRLNLRPLPAESPATGENSRRFARGVWEGDEVPSVNLGDGETWSGGPLSLSVMELGEHPETGVSWTDRTHNLLLKYGPFRLAWMESLVRIADWRTSAKEEWNDGHDD